MSSPTEILHPIQIAADRSGLSAHVIRVWEKRYGAVTPTRTATNRRLYADEHIERLRLLRQLTELGHAIGYIARQPTEQLRGLLNHATGTQAAAAPTAAAEPAPTALLAKALAAVEQMDAEALATVLRQAEVRLGHQGVLQRVIAPLAQTLGARWREGRITAAHEHFATAVLRLFLGHAARPLASTPAGPTLLVATPTGQLHELGALLAGAFAANLGWRIVYLGASLAAAEIAGAARQCQARAVALSLVYPEDDPELPAELARLRTLLPETPVIVGGRAASAYRETLDRIGAHPATDLDTLGTFLDQLRQPR